LDCSIQRIEYFVNVKLTVQIKLLPDAAQFEALRQTLELSNQAANRLSEIAWEAKEFRQFPLHRIAYKTITAEFPQLSSQCVIRLNGKVTDAYKLDQKVMRRFRPYGSICYDCRILRFMLDQSMVSIWTVPGRLKIAYACSEKTRKLLELPKGESDLILRGKDWFLNVSVEVPEALEKEALDWIGIDLGLNKLAQDSDGHTYGNAGQVAKIRKRRWRQRKRLQTKGTRSAKRVLRRLSGREARFIHHTNHTISKQICAQAERTERGIVLENLKGIRRRIKAGKCQRRILHSWAFADLQSKIVYKGRLLGVPVKFVDPRNTSRTCPACGCIDKANRNGQVFACIRCGFTADADTNGANNIRLAAIDRPHERDGVRAYVQLIE